MNNNFFVEGKSAVNFCEPDIYVFGCGEPWNVLSSLFIVWFGLYGLYLSNYKHSQNENYLNQKFISLAQLNILYGLQVCIGLGSVFFHYHLSPFAHWIDIIFISIMLVYSLYVLSNNLNKIQNQSKYSIIMIIHFLTSIYIPHIHIFLLFGTGYIIKKRIDYKIELEYIVEPNYKLINKYWWIKKYFALSLGFWMLDYFGCFLITPYHVHWIFHILIGLVSYKSISLIRYL